MKKKMEALAKDIYDWCIKKDLWGDCCIYFNGKAWASWDTWHDEQGKKLATDYMNLRIETQKNILNMRTQTLSL